MKQEVYVRIVLTSGDRIFLLENPVDPDSTEVLCDLPGNKLDFGNSPETFAESLFSGLGVEVEINDVITTTYSFVDQDNQIIGICFSYDIANQTHINKDQGKWFDIQQLDNIHITKESRVAIDKYISQNVYLSNAPKLSKIPAGYKLFTDGGSRGNPGPSAIGYIIYDTEGEIIKKGSKYIGITTNNQAEYQAVRQGLEDCIDLGASSVEVCMDSQLVVRQMSGIYKIKNRDLWPIHQAVKDLARKIAGGVVFNYYPRELNKEADAMVNFELDAYERQNKHSL